MDILNVSFHLDDNNLIQTLATCLGIPELLTGKSHVWLAAHELLKNWRKTVNDPVRAWVLLYNALGTAGLVHVAEEVLAQEGLWPLVPLPFSVCFDLTSLCNSPFSQRFKQTLVLER